MKKTVKQLVRELLAALGCLRKGAIEDHVRAVRGAYGDTVARRLREMENAGELEKLTIEGRTHYRLCRR